jgi:multidrug efflux pump subunit AcrB
MERMIRFLLDRRLLTNLIVVSLIAGAIITGLRAQREGFPSITLNKVVVTAALPGASAHDVETQVTLPIEEAVAEIDGLDSYHSVISDNLSVTTVELDPSFDAARIRLAELDIRRAVDSITDFPTIMRDKPVVDRIEAAKLPILEVALKGAPAALPDAAERLERVLERLSGVSSVTKVGVEDPEISIYFSPSRARELGVSLKETAGAVAARNVSRTGGQLEEQGLRRQVVFDTQLSTPEAVADTVIRYTGDGGRIRVADVARVGLGREDKSLRVHNDAKAGVSLVVRKKENADILDTVAAVRDVIKTTPISRDVQAEVVNDVSFMTRNRLAIVTDNGAVGLLLVVICLFLFLSRRAAVWVSVGIPTALAAAVVLLPMLGMTVNMISLGGFVVVLGMIVDAAVVVAERGEHWRGQGFSGKEASVKGAMEVISPVVASAITTVIAFSPLLALGGLPGKFIWYIPATVVLCLGFSVLESSLILPVHMAGSKSPKRDVPSPKKRGFVLWMERVYRRVLSGTLRFRYLVLILFIGFFVFAMGVVRPQMKFILLPQDLSDGVYLKLSMPPGTPLARTEAAVTAVENQIPKILGADYLAVSSRVGHKDPEAVDRRQGSAENEAVVTALLQLEKRRHTANEWAELLSYQLIVPKGATIRYDTKRIGPLMGRPVTVHVASNDDKKRRAVAAAIAEDLKAFASVAELEVDERPGARQIKLALNYEKLSLLGLDPSAVSELLSSAFHGFRITEHKGLEETTGIRILFEPSARRTLDDLLDSELRNRRNALVPLRDVVTPVEVNAAASLFHREGVRTATVTGRFAPGSPYSAVSFARIIEQDIIPKYASEDVDVYVGGEAKDTREITADMALAGAAAVTGIFLVVWIIMGSLIEALFVISVIPFGAAAIVIAMYLHDKPLSMFVIMAVIGLSGVVVNTAILMVDSVRRRLKEVSGNGEVRQAVIEGVVERLRPILVTTVTTLGGLFPLGYGLGGYDAFLSPMSLALGWGLLFSTFITLGLVPALYLVADDLKTILRRVAGRLQPSKEEVIA